MIRLSCRVYGLLEYKVKINNYSAVDITEQ
jgi:hypothetical protein